MNEHIPDYMDNPIPDYDGGLNALLAAAREQIVEHADNETWGIDRAIKAMRNTRAAATCLVAEINCFQQERAVLYNTISGILPAPMQLQEQSSVDDKRGRFAELADMLTNRE